MGGGMESSQELGRCLGVSETDNNLHLTSTGKEHLHPEAPVGAVRGGDVSGELEVEQEDRLIGIILAHNDANGGLLIVKEQLLS